MEPAYPLVLTDQGHALVGEMVEILGLTDHVMIETVARLDQSAVDKMKRSTNVPYAVAIWAYAVKGWAYAIGGRTNSPDVSKLVDIAVRERKEIAEILNDFIHSLFTRDFVAGKTRTTSELQALRDRAATLSCLIEHIDHCAMDGDHGPSPWLERLRPLLQEPPDQE